MSGEAAQSCGNAFVDGAKRRGSIPSEKLSLPIVSDVCDVVVTVKISYHRCGDKDS